MLPQGWSCTSDAGTAGYSSICTQSKAKRNPFLDGTFGSVHPLSDGYAIKAFDQLENKGNELSVCFRGAELKSVSLKVVCLSEPNGTGNQ